jgi:hypothetical protein
MAQYIKDNFYHCFYEGCINPNMDMKQVILLAREGPTVKNENHLNFMFMIAKSVWEVFGRGFDEVISKEECQKLTNNNLQYLVRNGIYDH